MAIIGVIAGCGTAAFLLRAHNVPLAPTGQDIAAAKIIMGDNFRSSLPGDYEDQISYIQQVQMAVAALAEKQTPIPYNQEREPADLLREKAGLCYDRSRTLEKILRMAGFRVRHVSIYAISAKRSAPVKIWHLTTNRTLRSHAVSECLTSRGWLVVDSLHPWISIDRDDHPVGLAAWHSQAVRWKNPPPEPIYQHPFTPIYGLYSRHGRFYPPFTPVPDINWREFIQNARSGNQ